MSGSIQDYFDRIVVINLPERTDRKKEMLAELKKIGCPLEHVTFFPALRPNSPEGFPSIGARGCFLSHQAVIDKALTDNVQRLLILEDDALFLQTFFKYSDEVLRELEEDKNWDFLYLGHYLSEKPFPPHLQKYNESLLCAHCFALNHTILKPLSDFLATVCQRPPGHPDGGPQHVDGAYNTFRSQHQEYVTLICYPSLVEQRSSRSDIAEDKWIDKAPILSCTVDYFRRIKNWIKSKY